MKKETDVRRALKRLLVNGKLTGWPRRPADAALLVALAAGKLEPRELAEREVNEALKAWLATFCEPFGIDHVTLRRALVDARYLVRDSAGKSYRVDASRVGALPAPGVEPGELLQEIGREREERKRTRPA
jgi:hypothetical protein